MRRPRGAPCASRRPPLRRYPAPAIAADQLKRFGARRDGGGHRGGGGHDPRQRLPLLPSKAALIDAVAGRWLKGVEAVIAEIADAPDPADDKLERLIQAWPAPTGTS
jgi:hypothetical protein